MQERFIEHRATILNLFTNNLTMIDKHSNYLQKIGGRIIMNMHRNTQNNIRSFAPGCFAQ